MERELSTLALPPNLLKKIHDKGFNYIADLRGLSSTFLCEATGLTFEEVNCILKEVFLDATTKCQILRGLPQVESAMELWLKECHDLNVSTSSQQLDSILGGGFPLGHLVEIHGVPGTAKTQMCLQLCVNAQTLSITRGDIPWEAIYIDTQGNFVVDRLKEIAAAAAFSSHQERNSTVESSMNSFLQRVHVFNCLTLVELIATIQYLCDYLQSNNKVKLIVVDNIAFLFRSFDKCKNNSLKRTQQLNSVGGQLIQLARKYNVLVIVVNQMTTRLTLPDSDSVLVSALGDSWAHLPSVRLRFNRRGGEENCFVATVIKSPTGCDVKAQFKVTKNGIEDTDPDSTTDDNPRKKMRHK